MAKKTTPSKTTSDKVASSASKVLRDGRTSKDSKTAAGSALSQHVNKKNTNGTGPRKK